MNDSTSKLLRLIVVLADMGVRNRTYAVEHFDRKKVLQAQETFLTDVVRASPC
jgi:hypothetical protein